MCGIFAIIKPQHSKSEAGMLSLAEKFCALSTRRGQDASGLAYAGQNSFNIIKKVVPASELFSQLSFVEKKMIRSSPFVFGHARMVTHGSALENQNNHPVLTDSLALFHNGIVVNFEEMQNKYLPHIASTASDSQVLTHLIENFKHQNTSLVDAITKATELIKGSYSILVFDRIEKKVCAVSNVGSLYVAHLKEEIILVASEEHFLRQALGEDDFDACHVQQISKGIVREYDFSFVWPGDLQFQFAKTDTSKNAKHSRQKMHPNDKAVIQIQEDLEKTLVWAKTLRRCRRCVLPETFPFINFDSNGICNHCLSHKSFSLKPMSEFKRQILQGSNSRYDCLLAFSGGRDSSYALHYLVKELGLRVATVSYDWGVITDLGRRNQARMTGALGVENILISADIETKRDNVRENLNAWCKSPHLGMVPLLMAGDKHYHWWANKIQRELDIPTLIMGENRFEKTMFKLSLAGIQQAEGQFMAYDVSRIQKLKLMSFYLKQFLSNFAYLNKSLIDSATGFFAYYGQSHDYLNIYDYINWNESEIDRTLSKYDWEFSPESKSSWRVGDGTPPLYNYIYYRCLGFTEYDTLYSNLIRDGQLSRGVALEKCFLENAVKPQALKWYADTIGFDLLEVRNAVEKICLNRS